MLRFEPVTKYDNGIVFDILTQGFKPVVDDKLSECIRKFDEEVFSNPETVGACTFVAEVDGKVAGLGSYDPRKWPESGEIGWNCILEDFRGKGFGRAQIFEILKILKDREFKKAFVRTGEHPFFVPAQKMYKYCGFVEVKRHLTGDQPGYGTIDYELNL